MTSFSLLKKLHAASGEITLKVECDIEPGGFVSIFGPSGAGKTSLLRMLAGFLKPDSGFIRVGKEVWFDSTQKVDMAPQKRHAGFVFQDYALFPNMNVEENLLFALRKGESKQIIDELLEMTGLSGLRKYKIQMLSGGQLQRVALGRAIARKPKLLLLDEPLSAIDLEMRERLQETLLGIHSRYGITTVLVSHDMEEIVRLSSRTLLLNNGVVEKDGPPTEIFSSRIIGASQIRGKLLSIEKEDSHAILLMLVGNQLIRVRCEPSRADDLLTGADILVSFKDTEPTIQKL